MQRLPSFFYVIPALIVTVSVTIMQSPTTAAGPPPEKTITITPVGNQMEFEQTEITANPGQTVTIIFENTATSTAMQHNVVVLNTADDSAIRRVGQAGTTAENYVPDDPAIITATDVAKPGETTKVTFTVPESPGEYAYICTYPGHYVSMQGTLIVEK